MPDRSLVIVSLLDVCVALNEVTQLLNVVLMTDRAQHFCKSSMVRNDRSTSGREDLCNLKIIGFNGQIER